MITIHCGLHKTGSSSIQLALKLIRNSTRRVIITPNPTDDRTEQGWSDRIKELACSPDAIFSDENLLGTPDDGYQLAPKRVAMLRDALDGSSYQIVVYLRPQLDWLTSVYLQGVQVGRTIRAEEFWTGIKDEPLLEWSRLLDLLRKESGAERVIARAHTRSRDAVADFFEVCSLGKPPRTGKTMIRINSSISAVQAPVLIALNELPDLTPEQRGQLRSVFQQALAPGAVSGLSPFPESVQREIVEKFRDDWLVVADSLVVIDPKESQTFRNEAQRCLEPLFPFAGATLDDAEVQREALRSLRLLSLRQDVARPTLLKRLSTKLRDDPVGVPQAFLRALRREC